jgi:transposase
VWLTFYRISPKRGSLLSDVMGIVVHDHWKPYYTMEGVLHALCNAHHLRELQALVDIEKEEWARRMQCLLRRACHATHLARGVPLDPRLVDQFRRRYDIIVTEGLGFHQDQPPLATPLTNGKRWGPRRTISFCVSAPARTTYCASWTIPPCPSPTIRPSATGA